MFIRRRLFILSSLLAIGLCGIAEAAANPSSTQKEGTPPVAEQPSQDITPEDIKKASQAFGHFIGRNLNTPAMQFDLEKVIQGIRDGSANKPSPLSDKEYEKLMMRIQKKAFDNLSSSNLKAADEFLAKNAHEPHIIVVEPGKLQYLILSPGTGPVVEPHGTPSINYVGKYLDGTVFGNSEEAGGPVNIPLDQTIPGFSKGIQGMKEGEKRRLFVHPTMGYGTMGQLPPNSLLIFDIEVVKASNPKEAMNDDDELLPLVLEDEEEVEENDTDEEGHEGDADTQDEPRQEKKDKPSTTTQPVKPEKKGF
jgi:peptidylprolyl isomerase